MLNVLRDYKFKGQTFGDGYVSTPSWTTNSKYL